MFYATEHDTTLPLKCIWLWLCGYIMHRHNTQQNVLLITKSPSICNLMKGSSIQTKPALRSAFCTYAAVTNTANVLRVNIPWILIDLILASTLDFKPQIANTLCVKKKTLMCTTPLCNTCISTGHSSAFRRGQGQRWRTRLDGIFFLTQNIISIPYPNVMSDKKMEGTLFLSYSCTARLSETTYSMWAACLQRQHTGT